MHNRISNGITDYNKYYIIAIILLLRKRGVRTNIYLADDINRFFNCRLLFMKNDMRCGSIYLPLNQSIPAHTIKINNTDIIAYPKVHKRDELKCPTQSTVSFQSHCRIASELAWIRSTPNVAPPIAFTSFDCGIFRSLKYMNEATAVSIGIILLLSATKKYGTKEFIRFSLYIVTIPNTLREHIEININVNIPHILCDTFGISP